LRHLFARRGRPLRGFPVKVRRLSFVRLTGGRHGRSLNLGKNVSQGISAISSQLHICAGTPDHPITITPADGRVRVTFAGHVVADSSEALMLMEASYPPVFYLPREHVDFAVLERTSHKTRCPYKGEASYYSIHAAGRTAQSAVWSYEQPLDSATAIAGYLAFYPDRVDSIEKLSICGEP
jgi:uncharacterized protein (DUF427 family)